RRLPAEGLARLLSASARLSLLDDERVADLLQRLAMVVSPIRPPPVEAVAALCQGLYLAGWVARGQGLWQIAGWLHRAGSPEAWSPAQASSAQRLALRVLADPGGRQEAAGLQPELRRALGTAALGVPGLGDRAVASDTTLKFRHEVAELLRSSGQGYDLDIRVGPGLAVDLAVVGAGGGLWLLDGPEAFHRPFPAGGAGGPPLSLVPGERRRAELIERLLLDEEAARMQDALRSWLEGGERPGAPLPTLGRRPTAAAPGGPLARLHWAAWAKLPKQEPGP
ncbi:unnamed protein product, partial [Prorocentrum cordatum]